MTAIKERLIGAVTIMNDEQAERLWNIILSDFTDSWENIEEETPDDIDLQMLEEIEKNPECHVFTSEEDIKWNE